MINLDPAVQAELISTIALIMFLTYLVLGMWVLTGVYRVVRAVLRNASNNLAKRRRGK